MRILWLILFSLSVFSIVNYSIYQKEQLQEHGETIFFELRPADPRALFQGDYMDLRYALEDDILKQGEKQLQKLGKVVIAPNAQQVAQFVRLHQGEKLAPGEKLMRYRVRYYQPRIVPHAFFFQEGQRQDYQIAKYGVFKFDKKGNFLLVALADENLKPITPAHTPWTELLKRRQE